MMVHVKNILDIYDVLNFEASQISELVTQIQWESSLSNSFLEEAQSGVIYRVDVGDFLHERQILLPVNTNLKLFLNKKAFKYCFAYYPDSKVKMKIGDLENIVLNVDLRTDIFDFVTIDKMLFQIPFEGYDGVNIINSFLPISFLDLNWQKYREIYKKEKKEHRRKTWGDFFERKIGWQKDYPKYPHTIKTGLEKQLYDYFLNDKLVVKWVMWVEKIKVVIKNETDKKRFLQEQIKKFLLENNDFPQVPIFIYGQKEIIFQISKILENEFFTK